MPGQKKKKLQGWFFCEVMRVRLDELTYVIRHSSRYSNMISSTYMYACLALQASQTQFRGSCPKASNVILEDVEFITIICPVNMLTHCICRMFVYIWWHPVTVRTLRFTLRPTEQSPVYLAAMYLSHGSSDISDITVCSGGLGPDVLVDPTATSTRTKGPSKRLVSLSRSSSIPSYVVLIRLL